MSKIKIAISGIGAVGGYYGGLLAAHYQDSEDVDIFFISRGENLKAIKEFGLEIKKSFKKTIAIPTLATDNPADRSGGLPALLHEKLRSGRKYPSPEAGHQSGDCHPTPAQRGRHRRTDRKNTARKQNMERLCLHRCAARFARIYREIHPQGPFVFRTQRQG